MLRCQDGAHSHLASRSSSCVFASNCTGPQVDQCFTQFDVNNDQRLSFPEFVEFYNWFQEQVVSEVMMLGWRMVHVCLSLWVRICVNKWKGSGGGDMSPFIVSHVDSLQSRHRGTELMTPSRSQPTILTSEDNLLQKR